MGGNGWREKTIIATKSVMGKVSRSRSISQPPLYSPRPLCWQDRVLHVAQCLGTRRNIQSTAQAFAGDAGLCPCHGIESQQVPINTDPTLKEHVGSGLKKVFD